MTLNEKQRAELEALSNMSDDEIDFSDIPETRDWSQGRRGVFYEAMMRRGAQPSNPAARPAPTDTTEIGLERRAVGLLTGGDSADSRDDAPVGPETREASAAYFARYPGGWIAGDPAGYDREHCVDLAQLSAFLHATQPETAAALLLDRDHPTRRRFLHRLQRQVDQRGVVDALRNGVKHGPHDVALYYAIPTPGNETAAARHRQNRFSVTRQLRYSSDHGQRALDLGLFLNGLPIATVELKNSLTRQTAADAAEQYRRDRSPREPLFRVGRCLAHFAVDDQEALFCTKLDGKSSVFLPFNRGWNDGAGNPPHPNGLKTDYLWRDILAPVSLAGILENYALLDGGAQIWPRYHQLDAVRRLLRDAEEQGPGQRYLIQHSAGSGKSNSIAWLAHQLITLARAGRPVFDSIIVVTDRLVLDRQIDATIRRFAQLRNTVGHADSAGDLRRLLVQGKKIIITTAQKFPFILNDIEGAGQSRNFAIIIDEAHSGQGGRTSAAMGRALAGNAAGAAGDDDGDDTFEDQINRIIGQRRLLPNASYFAFTATPKNRTLELFGRPDPQPDGTIRHLPFHSYTMKQAIQEGFICDVLSNYATVDSYYNLVKTVADDPQFDARRARRKLRRFVEGHRYAVRQKAAIIVDHFDESVYRPRKIDGRARAMVVTDGVARAIEYYHAIRECLAERGRPYQAIVAFSGEREYGGSIVSEASLNGFPSAQITAKIQEDPYRILICADKFQTGYDEPLLHTMYVDKTLAGVQAVQTLSRLNRAMPNKHDVFVLDFMNNADVIRHAFADYYRTTILTDEADPDKLHDLKAKLDGYRIYSDAQVADFVRAYLDGADRSDLDPALDACVAEYVSQLDEDGQVDFKGTAKGFVRAYAFLSQVLPYANAQWEKLFIFLTFLIPKLPAPVASDLSQGILAAVDMDSYRAERQAAASIAMPDEDALIEPIQAASGNGPAEPEIDRLTNILAEFNTIWGTHFTDSDRVAGLIETLPAQVAADDAYQNARQNSDRENARVEHDTALRRALISTLQCNTELYKQYADNPDFKLWLEAQIFALTYGTNAA